MPSRLNACPTKPGANPAPLRSVPVLLPTASPASPLARHQATIPAGGAAHGPGADSDSVTGTGLLSPGETRIDPGRRIDGATTLMAQVDPVANPDAAALRLVVPVAAPVTVAWTWKAPSGMVTLPGALTRSEEHTSELQS